MENLFKSIFNNSITVGAFFIMVGVSLATGLVISFILSFRMQSTKRFFISNAIMPAIVAMVIALVNGNIGAGIAVAGAFGLVRYRSAQGTSEEIGSIFISVATGLAFGMGYIAYGIVFGILMALFYLLLTYLPIFTHKEQASTRLVRITIPEDLNYEEAFEEIFNHFTKEHEYLRVKTSDMGSLYKLDVRVVLKNVKEVKEMIDEIRQRNGNMDVSCQTYINTSNQL